MSAKLGIKGKIYRNTATYGAPTWAEVKIVGDVEVSPEWDMAEGATRASRVKTSAKTMLALEVSGKIRVDNADAGYVAFRDAFYSDTPLDLLVLNGPSAEDGVHGWRAEFHVGGLPEDQSLGAVIFADFTLSPAISDNDPKKCIVASGVPVFSDVDAA